MVTQIANKMSRNSMVISYLWTNNGPLDHLVDGLFVCYSGHLLATRLTPTVQWGSVTLRVRILNGRKEVGWQMVRILYGI